MLPIPVSFTVHQVSRIYIAMPFATSSFLLLVVRPGAPSSFLLLVAMPFAPSSVLYTPQVTYGPGVSRV